MRTLRAWSPLLGVPAATREHMTSGNQVAHAQTISRLILMYIMYCLHVHTATGRG